MHYNKERRGEYKPRDETNLGGKWWPLPLLSCISSGKDDKYSNLNIKQI
jgi:hypothetical protein